MRPLLVAAILLSISCTEPHETPPQSSDSGDEESPPAVAAVPSPPVTTAPAPAPEPSPEKRLDGRPVLRLSGDVQKPVAVRKDSSALRALSGRYRWSTCLVEAIVSREGRIEQAELLRPENAAPEAREVILGMLEEWLFEPATLAGEPVDVSYYLLFHHCPSIARQDRDSDGDP